MTNYIKSAIATMLGPFARSRRYPSVRVALLLVIVTVASGGPASAAANEAEARAFFTKFVAAQNAHDADDVKAMLWNSPGMLWFSRGVETRGRDAVAARFKEYYEGTWHLEPDMSQFRVATISDDVVQILVPIVFTRGLPGKPPQDRTFLINQTYVRDADGWHVASILPIANTQLK
jgi:ketosteroid isomerase-like protein